jgi:CRP-like cAMP-binding protein/predicted GNAT family N-acyltransferase
MLSDPNVRVKYGPEGEATIGAMSEKPNTDNLSIRVAETDDERRAVYRLRYDVYVEEMGRYQTVADHENRLLFEDVDKQSRISYAELDGEVVATARLTWGGAGPIPQRMIDQYSLAPILAELSQEVIAIGERAMVRPHLRGSDILLKMMISGIKWVNEKRIELIFGDCEPHLLNLYLSIGQRTYAEKNINSPEAGYLIPIVTVVEDVAYFRQIRSPLAEHLHDFGDDARIPEIMRRDIEDGSAVLSRIQTAPSFYWQEVQSALTELEANRVSALDGFSEEDAARCLEKSSIIECDAGDRVLKKGGVARNLFVVLEGTLEVREGDRVLAVLSPGDVFGEMAFLLERPRSRDVYAATDDARVLSLSETQLRKMISSDPAIAAQLLLNISKMLCLRVLEQR